MNIQLPRDFQSYPAYRNLIKEAGSEIDACFIFMRLWTELAYQCDLHGQAGYFDRGCIDSFNGSMTLPGGNGKNSFSYLLAALVIYPKDEDYICPMFAKANFELNPDEIPDTQRSELQMRYARKSMAAHNDSEDFAKRLPDECWILPDGKKRMDLEEMKRCITLIKILDGVLAQKSRQKFNYEVGLIQDAYRVITNFSETQLEVILRRIYVYKYKNLGVLPRVVAQCLRDFPDLVYKVMPDDGYLKFDQRFYGKTLTTT